MAKVCQICQRGTSSGNNVSHSNRKTKRKFKINLHKKRIYDPVSKQYIEMKVCNKCLRSLKKI